MWSKILSGFLSIAVLAVIGAIVYVTQQPEVGESFTDFYILGLEGKAADYPGEIVLGEKGTVIVGIVNEENETATYRIEVQINGVKNAEAGPITLNNGEKWESEISFQPTVTGEDQEVDFLLFRDGYDGVYQSALLKVDVLP